MKTQKPKPKDYGYQDANSFDDESGWMLEGGEEAYLEALAKWQAETQVRPERTTNNIQSDLAEEMLTILKDVRFHLTINFRKKDVETIQRILDIIAKAEEV